MDIQHATQMKTSEGTVVELLDHVVVRVAPEVIDTPEMVEDVTVKAQARFQRTPILMDEDKRTPQLEKFPPNFNLDRLIWEDATL